MSNKKNLNQSILRATIDSLKEWNQQEKTLDDVILAMFYATNQSFVTKDPALLHRAFAEIKEENKILLLNSLLFNNNGVNPWSEDLAISFMALEVSELLPYMVKGNEAWYFLRWSFNQQQQAFMKFNDQEQKGIIGGSKVLQRLPKITYR